MQVCLRVTMAVGRLVRQVADKGQVRSWRSSGCITFAFTCSAIGTDTNSTENLTNSRFV